MRVHNIYYMGKINAGYKIRFRNHLNAVQWSIYYTVLGAVSVIYLSRSDDPFDRDFLTAIGVIYLIQIIPAILLHLEYYFLNRTSSIEIDDKNHLLLLDRKRIPFNDILRIEIHMSPTKYARRWVTFLSTDEYCYAKIFFFDGETLYFTSLLFPDVEKAMQKFSKVEVIRRQRLLASKTLEKLGLSEILFGESR